RMNQPTVSLPLIEELRQDVRALLRPGVRRVRGKVRATLNDLRGAVRTDRALTEPLREQWARVLRRSRAALRDLPSATGPRVLFSLAHGWGGARMCLESILALALR